MSEPILQVEGLMKSFGGVRATDNVHFAVMPLETHAIIGPNGAGKTTLIAQLSGALRSDAGTVWFKGRDITHYSAHQRSLGGLARSFQITSVFMDMTVLQNVALAIQAHSGHSFRFWSPAHLDPELIDPALQQLADVGLADRAHDLAAAMSHGERRQLEIAMALATAPELMLLDEPMAGMGREESERMVETLKGLKGEKAMLLVEHDMDAVFALADRITVLVYGRVIASGPPDEIRNDEAVRKAYLGDDGA
jgi:branched-chain amino acid transport system ATP-binding protein